MSLDRTVFVCGDTGQTRILNKVASTLEGKGIRVIRGPSNEIGHIRRYSRQECAQYLSETDVAVFTIRHECTKSMLAAAPRLRGVCFPTTGVESLDLTAASEAGILVGHGPTPANVTGMAEATIMLSLALLYRLQECEKRLADNLPKPSYPIARSLAGKVVGFVGFGRIARAIAHRLAPFGVSMQTYSPRTDSASLPVGVRKVELEAVMKESDLVLVLVSITQESRAMIGAAELSWMKPEAFIVNTGRGEAIDEAALHTVLSGRRIAGAALDTFAVEPLDKDSPLRTLDNVILTPHMVGQTQEAFDEFAPALTENIMRLLNDEPPKYCKNPEAIEKWRIRLSLP